MVKVRVTKKGAYVDTGDSGSAGSSGGRSSGHVGAGGIAAIIAILAIGGAAAYVAYKKFIAFRITVNGSDGNFGLTSVNVPNPGTGVYQVSGATSGDGIQIVYASSPSGSASTVFSPIGGSGTADSSGSYSFTDIDLHTTAGTSFTFYISAYDTTSQKYSNWVTVIIG